ncbi:hypothetical protein GO613_09245 [Azoarcus communis]|uniref:hypothetical protein n=1 Tax=Parazoarcus communis TaxID=41977 RepID=UPI0014593CD6|nr:hypothetical protein [Parazoarcus communis]NMG48284.1 hypothetical protein [Parazoarcus communis]
MKKVMVCGVDCHQGDDACNGYCIGKASDPPAATEAKQIAFAKETAHRALDAAEKAWYEYAGLCDVGAERTRAFDVYEKVRHARRL